MARAFLALFLLTSLALAQGPGAPIPRPRPPEEPRGPSVLQVEIAFEEKPLPGVLVILQPLAPNHLPTGKGTLRLTDGEGKALFPLSQTPANLLLSIQDRERALRLQMPLAFALGTWSLGPYRLTLSLFPP
ncbi:hypothetical protein [Thermus caliditerrae]|uniref:hypothetical protein n=1 Tax=Thermus caliditerrae TaxID=1330700 RepID=UPI00056DA784|nr:hypothetical protein [Thermus caliditerrae]